MKYETYFKLIIATGMRRGECCGLKWCDFDFPARSIHICRNVVKVSGEKIMVKEPKAASGDQYVYFSLEMESLLIANGTDVATVAGLLGHSQPSTTLDIYTMPSTRTRERQARCSTRDWKYNMEDSIKTKQISVTRCQYYDTEDICVDDRAVKLNRPCFIFF